MSNIIIGGPTQFTTKVNVNPSSQTKLVSSAPTEPFTAVWIDEWNNFGSGPGTNPVNRTTDATNKVPITGPYYYGGVTVNYGNDWYIGHTSPFNAVRLKMQSMSSTSGYGYVYIMTYNGPVTWQYYKTGNVLQDVSNLQDTTADSIIYLNGVITLKKMNTLVEGTVYWDMPNDWIQSQPFGGTKGEPSLYWLTIQLPDVSGVGDGQGFVGLIRKTTPP